MDEHIMGAARWFASRSADVEVSVPEDVKAEILENRARNERGLCFRSDCGQPLFDDHACPEHSEHTTKGEQFEARMKRLGVLGGHKHNRKRYL